MHGGCDHVDPLVDTRTTRALHAEDALAGRVNEELERHRLGARSIPLPPEMAEVLTSGSTVESLEISRVFAVMFAPPPTFTVDE